MPTFRVTDPQSGRTVKLTGDSAPTEQELEEIFSSLSPGLTSAQPPENGQNISQVAQIAPSAGNLDVPESGQVSFPGQPEQPQQPTFGQQALGALETGAGFVSGAVAEPVAGLAGLAQAANPFGEPGAGASAVEATREALTFQPRTQAGQAQTQALGEALAPIGEAVEGAGDFLGDETLALTGSPELATLAKTAPTAVIEALGLKGLRSTTLKKAKSLPTNAKKAVIEAAPSIEQLKTTSSDLYNQLDESGVKIRPQVYDKFVESIETTLKKEGLRRRQHPKAFDALQALKEEQGKPIGFQDLNSLRQTAADAATEINRGDARLGKLILNKVDSGIDRLADAAGKDARGARQLWRRARVSESIAGMVEDAGLAASGLENGLRIEARKILKSKRKNKGFTKAELASLRELEQGSTATNAAKFLGKFGISEGKATSMLGAAAGLSAGATVGGIPGAITAATIGQASKLTAQRLTRNKAAFADQLVRAGGDAREIARAYIKNTPKADRKVSDLTDLLLDQNVTPESIAKLPAKDKFLADAKFFASDLKRKATRAASVGATFGQLPQTPATEDFQQQLRQQQ